MPFFNDKRKQLPKKLRMLFDKQFKLESDLRKIKEEIEEMRIEYEEFFFKVKNWVTQKD